MTYLLLRTVAGLLGGIALLMAAGGTCPSDVNNDGTVGINDFLQVLSDWGPCPNATLVGIASLVKGEPVDVGLVLRVWSDNSLEVGADALNFEAALSVAAARISRRPH